MDRKCFSLKCLPGSVLTGEVWVRSMHFPLSGYSYVQWRFFNCSFLGNFCRPRHFLNIYGYLENMSAYLHVEVFIPGAAFGPSVNMYHYFNQNTRLGQDLEYCLNISWVFIPLAVFGPFVNVGPNFQHLYEWNELCLYLTPHTYLLTRFYWNLWGTFTCQPALLGLI